MELFQCDPRAVLELDFSNNYLGDRGAKAICQLLRQMPMIQKVNMRGNGMRDARGHSGGGSVLCLCQQLSGHPQIRWLDVSDNEINDKQGGEALYQLVTNNHLISDLKCDGTRMSADLKTRILDTVKANRENAPKSIRRHAYETQSSHMVSGRRAGTTSKASK
mmetsp:Transcript_22733/g.55662  ORF Transcript_22733/g.55662 Transcript_22733/m.55662 type:complete len:163 (+) Transcript_22733:1-489(+)